MNTETAVFGGGCFWCTEAVFRMLHGVESVEPGYAGGTINNPTYYDVSGGDTGHAEVIKIVYDPARIAYRDLLTVFFATHDATQVDRQGNDIGTQYRSIILTTTDAQKHEAIDLIEALNTETKEGDPVVTEVVPLQKFFPAEPEHLDYYARNQEQGYCQVIIAPKLQKVKEKFAALLAQQTPS